MLKIYILSAFLLGNIALLSAQHLVSYTYLRSFSKADVQAILDNFGVPSFLIKPEFDVEVYKVIYNTPNVTGTATTTVSGAIAIPAGVTCPLPLLTYQHGTTSRRYDVPSYNSAELQLGALFASSGGYIVTLSDYIGLGDSPDSIHPYCHAKSQATVTRDILRTARELKDSVGYNLNGQVFMFGYSQGGHATMAAFRELETYHANEFTVTACAPMSGPYDISGVQSQTITNTQAYSSPAYLPYLIRGYQAAYGNLYTSLSDIFVAPYDTMIPWLYDGTHSMGYINNRLPDTVSHMLQPAYYNDFLTNYNNPGRVALRDNDVYKWIPQAPLRMMYCHDDEQVFYQNAIVAYDTMTALGAQNVTAHDFGSYDHSGCLPFCMLDANDFFNQYKNVRGGMSVNSQVTSVSASGNTDGEIVLQPTGGVSPYQYQWTTGETTDTLGNLPTGTYIVRVSDSRGCYSYQPVQVGLMSGIEKVAETPLFKISPNPSNDRVFVQFNPQLTPKIHLIVRNLLGQIVYQTTNNTPHSFSFEVQNWTTGIYLVELHYDNQVQTQKLVVQP